ncbi:hypothetical protein HUG17_7337 [Dermatophagoides farinae]|uniref:ER-bound oxygenase mpaB/mpaB'/Rubber oxygenase catalytic domain-containing protein n=1 Tax=Dermatophagoides farinae TaxID=6954 RepID=A0A9D4SD12_DERFA|nr:uncharacterized protein LOC124495296 [Dermatophagoides farinae]KAH7637131.1 hypothetical protein HUG17_7337 [Dermatophagoides farinae]
MNLFERIKRRRTHILENANSVQCDIHHDKNEYLRPPEWFDPDNFRRAQQLFYTYKSTFILSFIYGLALTFYNPAELIPLMSTGKSKSVAHLFQRYLTTIEHIITWFEHYPFDKESKAYRSLLTVRQMHGQVSRKLNKLSSSTEPCWMNQHRMHNGQFAFIGLFAIFPKQLGFNLLTQQDVHCVFHFWRTIGHCLGIDDTFNLCAGSNVEIVEMCEQIFREEWLPTLMMKSNDESIIVTARRMSQAIFQSLGQLEPFINYNVMMRYGCRFVWSTTLAPAIDEDDIQLKNYLSKVHYGFTVFAYRHCSRYKWFHWLASRWLEYRLKQARQYDQHYVRCLERIYPDHIVDGDIVAKLLTCFSD